MSFVMVFLLVLGFVATNVVGLVAGEISVEFSVVSLVVMGVCTLVLYLSSCCSLSFDKVSGLALVLMDTMPWMPKATVPHGLWLVSLLTLVNLIAFKLADFEFYDALLITALSSAVMFMAWLYVYRVSRSGLAPQGLNSRKQQKDN